MAPSAEATARGRLGQQHVSDLALYLPEDRDGVLPITYFHAMARLGVDGLVLVEPREWFVSVGYFDDTEAAVDLDACRAKQLPVVRREIGGGPVLLGPGQVFYHVVLPRSHRALPALLDDVYRHLSVPVIETYRRLGVEVAFRPVNDLVTADGRKITGQGAADIGDRFCFVGAVLRHFDSALMASVLRVPDEKLRYQLRRTLDDNMSSVVRATGHEPPTSTVVGALADAFAGVLGRLRPTPVPPEVRRLAGELAAELQSPERLLAPRARRHTTVKIREGVSVRHGVHKALGGLVRATVTVRDGHIAQVDLAGDFTFLPKASFGALAGALVGLRFDAAVVAQVVTEFFRHHHVECPGVAPADFAAAVTGAPPDDRHTGT